MGALIGSLANAPRQVLVSGLPLILSSEEIDLLLSRNKISLYRFSEPHQMSEDYVNKFKLWREKSYQEQIEIFREERKKEIYKMGDKILEGKQKKMKNQDTSDEIIILDKDSILEAEVSKIGQLPRSQSLIQTFSAQPWQEKATGNLF